MRIDSAWGADFNARYSVRFGLEPISPLMLMGFVVPAHVPSSGFQSSMPYFFFQKNYEANI
jgi:hypothetical protein